MKIRRKILSFIVTKIAKIKIGEILPKWINFLRWILFPAETYLLTNKWIGYRPAKDTLFLYGQEYSRMFFELLPQTMVGNCFRVVKKNNGIITYESMNQCSQRIYDIFPDDYDMIPAAIKYIQDNYFDKDGNPVLMLGNVADLVFLLTGKQIDWKNLLVNNDENKEEKKDN